jgi:aconitate hydratase 2/2-methylisocitrate dehydratase
LLGRIPTVEEYMSYMGKLDAMSSQIYRYLNFNEVASFMHGAKMAKTINVQNIAEVRM